MKLVRESLEGSQSHQAVNCGYTSYGTWHQESLCRWGSAVHEFPFRHILIHRKNDIYCNRLFCFCYHFVPYAALAHLRCRFFLIRLVGGGVLLGPLGTVATDRPIVACPGWLWWLRIWWNEDWQGKPKYLDIYSVTGDVTSQLVFELRQEHKVTLWNWALPQNLPVVQSHTQNPLTQLFTLFTHAWFPSHGNSMTSISMITWLILSAESLEYRKMGKVQKKKNQ
jgi:hypothetical protein